MSSTISERPATPGPDDPTGRFRSVPGPVPGPGFPPPYVAGPQPGPWPPVPPAGLPPYGGYPVPRRRSRWGWIVLGVVAALLVLVTAAAAVNANRTMTVPGSVTLTDRYSALSTGNSCEGRGLWSWLGEGTPVTIYDASGAVVGTTSLGSGTASGTGSYGYTSSCVFPFTLTDVPAGDDFYRVTVGSGSGDGVTFTAQQLRDGGARVLYDLS